jgi:hypothetical protein
LVLRSALHSLGWWPRILIGRQSLSQGIMNVAKRGTAANRSRHLEFEPAISR